MKTNKTIGFFGGSFSPPHFGHFLAACYAQQKYNLDEVWFCPTQQHALGKSAMDFNFRLELCHALIEHYSSVFKVSDIESSPQTDGKTYTTLSLLKKQHPKHQFKLIIGSDILEQKHLWYRFEDIEKDFGLCLIPRASYTVEPFSIPNFSSTHIRKLLVQKNFQSLEKYVPSTILSMLKKQHN